LFAGKGKRFLAFQLSAYFCDMIIIENTLVSEDVLEKNFICDIEKCKGACCIEGDAGAPLNQDELLIIESQFENIKPFLSEAAIQDIERRGFYEKDKDGDFVTTCQPNGLCNFANIDKQGILACGMEQAFLDRKITFKKPISCHLYPIRIKEYSDFSAVNYHKWHICSDACALGQELGVPVYQFVKEALIRKFGQQWFDELDKVAKELKK
jgi:Fe-S-cluster containining protein